MSILIITSTVTVNSCLTVLVDPKIRLQQYVDSIYFYLNSKRINKIIVCDNSGFDYSKIRTIEEFANKKNKIIEFLSFVGSADKILEFGKGYGESEIMSYVFKNSKLIREDEMSFLKVSGRLKILNIDSIVLFFKPHNTYFKPKSINPFLKLNQIDTRFYQCNKLIFNQFFHNNFLYVNDKESVYLEHVFYNKIRTEKIPFENFKTLPYFVGYSGSTGNPYKISIIKFYLNRFVFIFYKFFYKI